MRRTLIFISFFCSLPLCVVSPLAHSGLVEPVKLSSGSYSSGMKMLLKVLTLSLIVAVGFAQNQTCRAYFIDRCFKAPPISSTVTETCNPIYGGVGLRAADLHTYIKEHIGNSFEYLLQWANFNNYKKDREGFAKLYRKLSDETWEDAIKLTKYLGKRGLTLDIELLIGSRTKQEYGIVPGGKSPAEGELTSLGKVLDLHKQLAISGNALHGASVKHDSSENKTTSTSHQHDVELAHFIEEEFSEKHAQTVRDLAGHANDLHNLLHERNDTEQTGGTGLYIYLFDEYLRKIY